MSQRRALPSVTPTIVSDASEDTSQKLYLRPNTTWWLRAGTLA